MFRRSRQQSPRWGHGCGPRSGSRWQRPDGRPATGSVFRPEAPRALPVWRRSGPPTSILRRHKLEQRSVERSSNAKGSDMSDSAPTFTADIKPLFRESDRESMRVVFDLWSFDDVSVHSGPIFEALSAGSMPCDGPWPSDKVELLRRWIDVGKPE